METLIFRWDEKNDILNSFLLTKVWNQFAEFKQFDHQNILLRRKEILKNRVLHEDHYYKAVLECKSKREIRNMTYFRYQLIIKDEQGTAVEILSDFVVVSNDIDNQINVGKESLYSNLSAIQDGNMSNVNSLSISIDWADVMDYLEKVKDDNPVHPQIGVIPGDYIAIQVIQYCNNLNSSDNPMYQKAARIIRNYRSINLKFIHPMYREEQLFYELQVGDNCLTVTVFNQYGKNCMILKCEEKR